LLFYDIQKLYKNNTAEDIEIYKEYTAKDMRIYEDI